MQAMLLPVLVASLLMLQQNQAPAVPAIVHDPDYPLRVQVAQTGSNSAGFRKTTGYGHGNVLGPPLEGFDYTEDCNQPFSSRPEADQYFRARWKKPGQRLEVLIQVMGSDRVTACELKVAMQDEPYQLNPANAFPRLGMISSRPAVPVTESDPKFPLRLQLWGIGSGFSSMAGAHAEGYGNVIGPPAQGFDFANECPVRLATGRNNSDVYQGRWVEQGLQLEILLQEVGTRQQSVCRMDVGMKSEPYPVPARGPRPVARPSAPQPPHPQVQSPQAPGPQAPGPQAPTSNSDSPLPAN